MSMSLGELIARLEREDPQKVLPLGFNNPHSYRGDYYDLAFEPCANITVGDMLFVARSAVGQVFDGYKGGDYRMDLYTTVWLSAYGDTGETIGPILLEYLLQAGNVVVTPASTLASPLFQLGDFTLHSGRHSSWKIECDSLTDDDWAALAKMVALKCFFRAVEGVPRGGLKFAYALEPYAAPRNHYPLLIVDDVLTTGQSMEEQRSGRSGCIGVVAFARTPAIIPDWVYPIWQLYPIFV